MEEEGFDPAVVEMLHAPIGLAIGAITPEEIALAIVAEIVKERRATYRGDFADTGLIERLADLEAETDPDGNAAVITILSTEGSTPREAGAKMAVFRDGSVAGTIGGGCAEADVLRDARDVAANGGFLFKTVDMTDSAEEDGMVCGGTMRLLIESFI
jgi:xanthine dehydrogenase accessory factor